MKCEKTDDFFVMRVQISVDLSREQRGKSAVFSPSERVQFRFHLARNTTPTLFAYGEFYCYAVIFGLRRVVFAARVSGGEENITSRPRLEISLLRKQKYHAVKDSISLKNHQEGCTYSPLKVVVQ